MSEVVRRPPDDPDAIWRKHFRVVLALFGLSVLALLLLLAALGLWWNRVQSSGDLAQRVRPVPANVPQPVPVAVVPVRPQRTTAKISLPVQGQPVGVWSVTAPASGRLDRFLIETGTSVADGQVIARIETSTRVARPRRSLVRQWRTRPPARSEVLAWAAERRRAQREMDRAESAARVAETDLAVARAALEPATARREAAQQESAATGALVARLRGDVAEREAALRQSERLLRAGAASRAEHNDDRSLHAAAVVRLEQALARAQEARSAAGSAQSATTSAAAAVDSARDRQSGARADLEAAHSALQIAESTPMPQPDVAPTPVSPRTPPVWSEVTASIAARAPAGGVVSERLVRAGSWVTRGQPLARLTRVGSCRYSGVGPAERLRDARPGMAARLRSADGAAIPARVTAVSRSRDGRRVAIEAIATRRLPERRSSRAALELDLPSAVAGMSVPAPAVRRAPSGDSVWIARRDAAGTAGAAWAAHRLPVRRGAARRGRIEIHAGLEPGSRAIVAGMEGLSEGQSVTVIPWALP